MRAESREVLLVDDNPDDRFLFQAAWTKAGIENPLRTLDNGQEACDYLGGEGKYADRAGFPLPALVLLDIKMPGKSGFEVLEWLRGRAPSKLLPVIMLTASTSPGDVAQAYRLGANSFAIKPSSVAELIALAAALKSWWLTFNEFA